MKKTTMDPHPGERYNLKWHSHKSSLVNYVADHLTDEVLVDVILACEGKFIKAHKLILSACSSYFKELFQLHSVDKPLIIMNNVKFDELKAVVNFIYNGEIRVLDSDLQGILTLGNNLKIKGLSSVREKIMDQNIDEMFQASNCTEKDKEGKNNQKKQADSKTEKIEKTKVVKKPLLNTKGKALTTPNNRRKSERVNSEAEHTKTTDEAPKTKKRKTAKMPENEVAELAEESTDVHTVLPPLVPYASPIVPRIGVDPVKVEEPPEIIETPSESPCKTPDSGGTHPQRPKSAFMIFANEWRKRLAVEHPTETNKQISVRLSNMWKNLSDETRDTFYSAASKANAEQKQTQNNSMS